MKQAGPRVFSSLSAAAAAAAALSIVCLGLSMPALLPELLSLPQDAGHPLMLMQQHARQVNGAIGCMARMPLPTPPSLTPHRSPSTPHLAREASTGSVDGGSWRAKFGNDVWGPYIRETALRVFASGALSAQVSSARPCLLCLQALHLLNARVFSCTGAQCMLAMCAHDADEIAAAAWGGPGQPQAWHQSQCRSGVA